MLIPQGIHFYLCLYLPSTSNKYQNSVLQLNAGEKNQKSLRNKGEKIWNMKINTASLGTWRAPEDTVRQVKFVFQFFSFFDSF